MSPGDELFDLFSEIETERLLMRRVTMRDAEDMFAYSKDPEVARHVLWNAHQSIGETRTYIRYMQRKYRMGDPSSLVITRKDTGRVIGTIGFMWMQKENRSAEVGYSLARNCWNLGFMTEALRAIVEFGFVELHLNRIEAQHEVDNPASGAVMRKVGMRREGTLRSRLFNKGKFVDVELYAILRKDFDALRNN